MKIPARASLLGRVLFLIGTAASIAAAAGDARGQGAVFRWLETTRSITFRSEVLGEERTLLVRVPYDYESSDERYPVLLLLDAEWHFDLAAADIELLSECSYTEPHPAPRLIVVGVVNEDRNRDFTPSRVEEDHGMRFPTSGGAEPFRRFLAEEVVPLIEANYRTRPYRILAGWSLGGLFTVNSALAGGSPFEAFLAISPSLWWDGERTLSKLRSGESPAPRRVPAKLVATLGTREEGSRVDRSTRAFLACLDSLPRGDLQVELVPIEGLGHNYSPKMAYFYGVAQIFGDWTAPAEVIEQGLEAIDAYYASLGDRYHMPVPIPEGVYGKLGWALWEAGEKDAARDVFLAWVDRHPRSPVGLASLGSFYRENGDREAAVRYLRAGMEEEKRCARPRTAFLADLARDIEALTADE